MNTGSFVENAVADVLLTIWRSGGWIHPWVTWKPMEKRHIKARNILRGVCRPRARLVVPSRGWKRPARTNVERKALNEC